MSVANIIHAAYFSKGINGLWGLPIFFVGEPGIGKSSILSAFTRKWDIPLKVLSPALHGEGAFGVIPVPGKDGLDHPAPTWTREFTDGGLVFVDEPNAAGPALQPPIMGLVCDRRIGDHFLGERTRTLMAMNPVEVAANGHDLSAPLANRGGWVKWDPQAVETFVQFLMGEGQGEKIEVQDAKKEEARVEKAWPEAYARSVGLISSFLMSHPDLKNKCPKAGDPAASGAWPSDRSWDMALRALAGTFVHSMTDADKDSFVAGFIGPVAYEALSTFIEQADMPHIPDVADGKVAFEWNAKRLDRCAAILSACVALVVPSAADRRVERAARIWTFLGNAGAYDITVPAAQALVKAGLHLSKEAAPVLTKIHPALRAAGIRAGEAI
jgi:hypothetical protein